MTSSPPFPDRMPHPSGLDMTLQGERLLVAFTQAGETVRRPIDDAGIAEHLATAGLALEDEPSTLRRPAGSPSGPAGHAFEGRWAHTADGGAVASASLEDVHRWCDWVAPVYGLTLASRRELVSPLPHALVVRPLAADFTLEELQPRLSEHRLAPEPGISRHLGGFYLVSSDPWAHPVYQIHRELLEETSGHDEPRFEVDLEHMPMHAPLAFVPDDAQFSSQWNLERIAAGGNGWTAWDLEQGDPAIVIAVLDNGCLPHEDLEYTGDGVNAATLAPPATPLASDRNAGHGTASAGIAAARIGNGVGIAGVAGGCRVLPVALSYWTDVEVAVGIRFAARNGARVISMGFGTDVWSRAIVDPAIQEAYDRDAVLCAATQNHDAAEIAYPASNPLVIACGASNREDARAAPGGPDQLSWGSNYGQELSVVAPGVAIPASVEGPSGYANVEGTSAATPQVAGLAALLLSRDPSLSNVEVRYLIERTADKVGGAAYAHSPAHPNGTWNQHLGYGRINAHAALRGLDLCRSFPSRPSRWHDRDQAPSRPVDPRVTWGPIFVFQRGSAYLDVQPTVELAADSLEAHLADPPSSDHREEDRPLNLDDLVVFDGEARRVQVVRAADGAFEFVLADDTRHWGQVRRWVERSFSALRDRPDLSSDALSRSDFDELVSLRSDYRTFREFALDVQFRLVGGPLASSGSWLHNLFHRLRS